MKSVAVIQARVSSTRLPEKALKDLCGHPLIFHVIERAKKIRGIDQVILATGKRPENQPLVEIAESMGISHFTGSEDDVLGRFWESVKNINCDYVIRITGDNPFTDNYSASMALDYAIKENADHCYITGIPIGAGIEIIKKTAIEKAYKNGLKPHHREHVTPYIKENPRLFKLVKYTTEIANPFPDLRLTVDTDEDFALAELLYKALYKGKPLTLTEVINYVKMNPSVQKINRDIKQRPLTHASSNE